MAYQATTRPGQADQPKIQKNIDKAGINPTKLDSSGVLWSVLSCPIWICYISLCWTKDREEENVICETFHNTVVTNVTSWEVLQFQRAKTAACPNFRVRYALTNSTAINIWLRYGISRLQWANGVRKFIVKNSWIFLVLAFISEEVRCPSYHLGIRICNYRNKSGFFLFNLIMITALWPTWC